MRLFSIRLLSSILLVSALATGCASNPDQTLSIRDVAVRNMAMACYQSREGERILADNAGRVWLSCQSWASHRVDGRLSKVSEMFARADQNQNQNQNQKSLTD